MKLTAAQLNSYQQEGFLLLPSLFTAEEVTALKNELPTLAAGDGPHRVLEKDGRTVRALHGSHAHSEPFRLLASHPRLLAPAEQILGSPVYVHQFKINVKAAFVGDIWKWHQDFIFWLKQDGMREPRAFNAMVFLDEVTEFNGPLYVVPRTHHLGVLDAPSETATGREEGWRASFVADLKYSITKETLESCVGKYGIAAPKGPAGSVLITHCNLVHGSPPNMSPFDRVLAIVTYNSVHNSLDAVDAPRPEFLVSRDFTPLVAVADDALRSDATAAPALAVN
jgi:hypothetical protein